MRKIKIVAMLIVAMFVGLAATSTSGAVYLNADINVKIAGFIGVVSPEINQTTKEQENQTVTFLVNVSEPGDNPEDYNYTVEDKIIINLSLVDNSNRAAFFLPRYMFYRVVLVRDIGDAIALPKKVGSLFNRLMPVKVPLKMVGIVNTLLGGTGATNISIPVKYKITNETYNQGKGFENLTLRIFTMGFLPGNINGIGGLFEGKLPIVDFKEVNLDIEYDEKPVEL